MTAPPLFFLKYNIMIQFFYNIDYRKSNITKIILKAGDPFLLTVTNPFENPMKAINSQRRKLCAETQLRDDFRCS